MNIINISNLFYKYNKTSIRKYKFNNKNDDFLAIIGPNGGGKSTLLKINFRNFDTNKVEK